MGCLPGPEYERRVMALDGAPAPPELTPCEPYEMSDGFRAWLVEQMRGEVQRAVAEAGVDRMAVLKRD